MVAATEPPGVSAWKDPWRSLGGGPSASSSASAGSSSSAGDGAWADGSDGTAPRGDSFAHATERASFKAQERALGTAWHAADVGYEAAYNAERQLADLAGTTNIEVRSETEIRDAIDHDVKIVLYNNIHLRQTLQIYNVTNVTILGNLFKIDGLGEIRGFFIGHYSANKPQDEYARSELWLEEVIISNCYDQHNGGAIYMYGDYSVLHMTECVLHDNTAGFTGGAIGIRYGASAYLTGCTFYDNLSYGEGDDVYLTHPGAFVTLGCTGKPELASATNSYTFLDCGIYLGECNNTYYSYVCASPAPTLVPTSPTPLPTQPSPVPTEFEPTQVPTYSPTFGGPKLNLTLCPKFPLPRPTLYNCEMKRPIFNVHNSREIGVFPTLLEGRDYFYAHPMKIFRTLDVYSQTGKDIKSAYIRFEDSDDDGVADYTAGDYLYFYDTDTIKGIYSKGSGFLKIKGRDTPQGYQDALRDVAYRASEFEFLKLVSAGNQIQRNLSIVINDVQGYSSETVYRELEVIGSRRMYSENAVGRLVCTSKVCGGLGVYLREGAPVPVRPK